MQTLEELAQYIRETIPTPRALLQLRPAPKANGVSFIWHGTEFFVSISFQVFEVRGHTLYITGLSTLLQAVLANKKQNEKRLNAIVDQISEIESLLLDQRLMRRGTELLRQVRSTIEEMAPKRDTIKEPLIQRPLVMAR